MFSTTVTVRGYECDANGHVNHAVYHQYGEHGRTETLRDLGIEIADLTNAGLGPVILETTVRFLAELRAGDEVDVLLDLRFGQGKTFRMDIELRRGDVVAATITGTMGLLDHTTRRLVADPRGRLQALASPAGAQLLDDSPEK
ncbi:acyl-CoA thioester hydrolase [Actinomycetospora succinea]|uniref:Acyl-CoA thioester hydrolase n=1 Tax=Actinomycetospora succinea TaxID=663603 RepID=A0A4R6VLT3_9PSEU|nr:thioesterase family protein [Actinomycetospora succinea]TDQ62925.1 acyl-CoA thioester hydrolase [Actinomycetospora succinea]